MGRVWMPGGGGSGDFDLVTAAGGDVLKGKVIIGPDGEPLTGTLELSGNAADSQVLSGKTYYNTDAKAKRTGGMANQGAKTASLNCGGSYTIPAGYHNGSGKVTANSLASQTDANAAAGDILSGKTAWVKGSKVTGSMAAQAGGTYKSTTVNQTISCSGKKMTGNVVIQGDSKLVAGNIKKGVTILGVTGTWEGYVVAATDLYYMGQNPAGFSRINLNSSSDVKFESNQITLKGAYNYYLATQKAYNLTGYSKIIIEGSLKGSGNVCTIYGGDSVLNGTNNNEISRTTITGTVSSITFSFSNKNITKYLLFKISTDTGNNEMSITRIRLA